jgi:hypothetical protein
MASVFHWFLALSRVVAPKRALPRASPLKYVSLFVVKAETAAELVWPRPWLCCVTL